MQGSSKWANWAGLGMSLAFIPGIRQAATQPRWSLAAAVVGVGVVCGMRARLPVGLIVLIGVAVASLLWAPIQLDGLDALAKVAICVGIFVLGCQLDSRELGTALAWTGWGVAANGLLAVGQALGWHPVLEAVSPSGLLGNKNFLAEAAVLVLVSALATRRVLLASCLLPALLLPVNRGAFMAAGAIGIMVLWTRSRPLAIAASVVMALCLALAIGFWHLASVDLRIQIWLDSIAGLRLGGNGIGQFYSMFPSTATHVETMSVRPDNAHNDLLELIYELGGFGILALGWLAKDFSQAKVKWQSPAGLVVAAFLVDGLVAFPLHNPLTAWIGFLAAGSLWACGRNVCAGQYGWSVAARTGSAHAGI